MNQQTLKHKLESIVALAEECLQELGTTVPKKQSGEKPAENATRDIVLSIVNKVADCDEAVAIQKTVLDKSRVEGKILLPFYISHKYFENEWLNTGHIEKITSELGIKMDIKNVSKYIPDYKKYLESATSRKKGQPTPYRLNRNGVKRFEEIISTTA
ncbi:MAG: hypothetical protein JWL88_393 [Parcubacteria group bacterium]|nr:hypothetical protein [Parcubacteria group bacterium]